MRFSLLLAILIAALLSSGCASFSRPQPLVLITDFGNRDGAVSAMKGVAAGVDSRLMISDLTHDIPPYNIWDAAYRLQQTYKYWPKETVFVAVIDPGVGSARKSIVGKTKSGHYFVGPDNGLFTLVGDESGWSEVRVIEENAYRRKGSEDSYTFHGRDVYAFVGAQLAAGHLRFSGLGQIHPVQKMVRLNYQKAEAVGGAIKGTLPVLDPNYGNAWSNISRSMLLSTYPQVRKYKVVIQRAGRKYYQGTLPLVDSFAGVAKGAPLLYFNSLLNLSVALNQANFADRYGIKGGPDWTITVSPVK